MTKKQWLIGIVLADFVALNVWAVMQYGYVGSTPLPVTAR